MAGNLQGISVAGGMLRLSQPLPRTARFSRTAAKTPTKTDGLQNIDPRSSIARPHEGKL